MKQTSSGTQNRKNIVIMYPIKSSCNEKEVTIKQTEEERKNSQLRVSLMVASTLEKFKFPRIPQGSAFRIRVQALVKRELETYTSYDVLEKKFHPLSGSNLYQAFRVLKNVALSSLGCRRTKPKLDGSLTGSGLKMEGDYLKI